MTAEVLKLYEQSIKELCWVERYGGLTRIVEDSRKGTNKVKYPVACGITDKECFESNKFVSLVPNDQYKSILYFEENGDTVTENDIKGSLRAKTKVRLIGWLNMSALGYEQCSISQFVVPGLIRELQRRKKGDSLYNVYFSNFILDSKMQTERVFKQYSYGDKGRFLFCPFDYFSITMTLNYCIDTNCSEFECKEGIECVEL